jgi:hypothetical protein
LNREARDSEYQLFTELMVQVRSYGDEKLLSPKTLSLQWAEDCRTTRIACDDLASAIAYYSHRDQNQAGRFRSIIDGSCAHQLFYNDPHARWRWFAKLLECMIPVFIDEWEPWFFFTLMSDAWNTVEGDKELLNPSIKRQVQGILSGLTYIGHLETVHFKNKKRKIDGTNKREIGQHAHGLAWGEGAEEILSRLNKTRPPLRSSMTGFVFRPVDDFIHDLSYATAAPTYGERIIRRRSGQFDTKPASLNKVSLIQRMIGLHAVQYPDIVIAGGAGVAIRDRVLDCFPGASEPFKRNFPSGFRFTRDPDPGRKAREARRQAREAGMGFRGEPRRHLGGQRRPRPR